MKVQTNIKGLEIVNSINLINKINPINQTDSINLINSIYYVYPEPLNPEPLNLSKRRPDMAEDLKKMYRTSMDDQFPPKMEISFLDENNRQTLF